MCIRDSIRAVRPLRGPAAPAGALDLRLGATRGSVAVELAEEASLLRAARLRVEARPFTTDTVVVAPVAAPAFLSRAGSRHIPVAPA